MKNKGKKRGNNRKLIKEIVINIFFLSLMYLFGYKMGYVNGQEDVLVWLELIMLK